jgi:hypothetical protein
MLNSEVDSFGSQATEPRIGAVINKLTGQNLATPSPHKEEVESFDPFDPKNLRIDQSFLKQGVAKKLLTTIPVRKPHRQDFVRVHPDVNYRVPTALLEYERDTYILTPGFAPQRGQNEYYMATIYVCINRQKVVSLWPVKTPGVDGKQMAWHTSAQEAAELAMSRWVRVTANMDLGAYEISEALAEYDEPVWPDLSFRDLLKIGFKNRMIACWGRSLITE